MKPRLYKSANHLSTMQQIVVNIYQIKQNRAQEREDLLLLLSFFVWLIGCLILQGITYYEHHRFSTEEKESIFFDDILDDDEEDGGVLEQRQNVGDNFEDGDDVHEIPTNENDDEEPPEDISEAIGSTARTRRELMQDATEPSFRQTGKLLKSFDLRFSLASKPNGYMAQHTQATFID